MWGHLWGSMVWTNLKAVPALHFWSVLLTGVVLGAIGRRALRGAKPRTVGMAILALFILVPMTAAALTLPFTFTNGTVADATQVNANFAALLPVTGFNDASLFRPNGLLADEEVFMAPFTATRTMTCIVNVKAIVEIETGSNVESAISYVAKREDGVVTRATTSSGFQPEEFLKREVDPSKLSVNQTVSFSTTAGTQVAFGAHFKLTGIYSNRLRTVVVYSCQ